MRLRLVVAALAVAFAPCLASAGDVKRDFDKDYDFGKVKTFATKIGTSWGNPISEKRVTTGISEVLTAKGWTPAPESEADALVILHGAGGKQKSLDISFNGMRGYGYRGSRGWGEMGRGSGTLTTTTTGYPVETLVVDIFDAKSKNLTFRGTAIAEVADNAEKNQKKLDKITAKMFKDFPPGSANKK
jgi:hypothetical protein